MAAGTPQRLPPGTTAGLHEGGDTGAAITRPEGAPDFVYEHGMRRAAPSVRSADVDLAAPAAGAKGNRAGGCGEQGVVAALADVRAGVHLGAPLADDDGTGFHGLAVEGLGPEPLGVGVAAVLGRAAALGLRHVSPPRPRLAPSWPQQPSLDPRSSAPRGGCTS